MSAETAEVKSQIFQVLVPNGPQFIGVIAKQEPHELAMVDTLLIVPNQGFANIEGYAISVLFPTNIIRIPIAEDSEVFAGYQRALSQLRSGIIVADTMPQKTVPFPKKPH